MDSCAWMVFNAFMHKLPQPEAKQLLDHLPIARQQTLAALPSPSQDPTAGFTPFSDLLGRIHFSWFTPYLRSLTENDIRLFISCLPDEQSRGLKKALFLTSALIPLSSMGKDFLQQRLLEKLLEDQTALLPPECIPDTPLFPLLELSFSELLRLIDLIGLHDLAVEIRQIIDTTKIKKIYSLLNEAQQNYLRTLTQSKEPVTFKRIAIQKWDGNPEELHSIIHQRGINRLAKALYEADESLTWYLSHRLDQERGAALLKLRTSLEHPKAYSVLANQILDAMNILKHKTPESP